MKMESMLCPQCGAPIRLDNESDNCICPYCGTQIKFDEQKDHDNSIVEKTNDEISEERFSISKEDLIELAHMNIDDLKKKRNKRIFTSLGITAIIVAAVGAFKSLGVDENTLNTLAGVAIATNAGVVGVSTGRIIEAFMAVKTAKEGLEKFEEDKYNLEDYKAFLIGAIEYAGKTLEQMETELEHKGVSM